MTSHRLLIVNADDFGLSAPVNSGIARAHEYGIVSSASLMVNAPAAAEAAKYAKARRALSLGLHVDLGSWVYREGQWVEHYHVVRTDDPDAVAHEVDRQVRAFQMLVERNPSHLDSHQHVHLKEPVRSILLETARRLNVPLRSFTPRITYCGDYYGQTGKGAPLPGAIEVEALSRILMSLPEGITELGCHPASGLDSGDPVYNIERHQELQTLCDPRILSLISSEGIERRSFLNVGNSWWAS